MKHAGPSTLNSLQALIEQLRGLPGLVERKPGIFYVKSQAYLHFHEDPAGIFADAKLGSGRFERFAVDTAAEQQALLDRVRQHRSGGSA